MEEQDKLINNLNPQVEEKKENVDSVLTEEEKAIFKKAGDISREFLNNYELAKQHEQFNENPETLTKKI